MHLMPSKAELLLGNLLRLACQRHLDDLEKSKIVAAPYQIHFQDGSTGAWSWQPPNYSGTGYIDSLPVGGYTYDNTLYTDNCYFFVAVLGGAF